MTPGLHRRLTPDLSDADRLATWRDPPTRYDEIARVLVEMGWSPVPLHPDSKIPSRKGWQHRSSWPTDALRNEIVRELRWRGDADRRGAACGVVTPAIIVGIDCDLLDRRLSDALWQLMVQVLGPPAMVRVGQSPKWLAIYRAQPGITTRRYPGLDVLAVGTQFAAFGIHHKTGLPYAWSERNPLNTLLKDL